MKKFILLVLAFLIQIPVFAGFKLDMYVVEIEADWINKSISNKETIITEVRDIVFEKPIPQELDISSMFSEKLKDKNSKENYLAASSGFTEYKDNMLSAFYYKRMKNIYMYALRDKKDLSNLYYYDAIGNLKYVDFIEGAYPDYPYTAIQYKRNGKATKVMYYISKDCQYLFTPKGEFVGLWYKYDLYSKDSKVILKRTMY